MKKNRIFAGCLCLITALCLPACSKEIPQENPIIETQENNPETEPAPEQEINPEPGSDPAKEIFWLSDYDLNPLPGQQRDPALAIFEDQYHGKITWLWCDPAKRTETLTTLIQGGDAVDMVSFQTEDFPSGIREDLFQPLDTYLDLTDPIWDGVRNPIENYAYNGAHYVIPYTMGHNLLLIYDRNVCTENSLADPYELYQSGEWTWDAFLDMMQEFTAGNSKRSGITGNVGRGILQSTGIQIAGTAGQFGNHIEDPAIGNAENLIQTIANADLYDPAFYNSAPENILFYAMEDWALDQSNAINPDADYMAVPFPKETGTESYYLTGNYESKLLVKNSTKGEAVAAYLYCERLAHTDPAYLEQIKEYSLTGQTSAAGQVLSYRTEEQYNAILDYQTNLECIIDPAYGMGSELYGDGEYTYETKGVMNRLEESILKDGKSWEEILADCNTSIDDTLKNYK
ncbi:MAG: extracellular solute-binding protein [Oscillospiraceae bacterium]|nr:extracellular solute-binding protein [Oscillospiraceae bacterium]